MVYIAQSDAVEVSVLAHLEAIAECTLRCLQGGILDGVKLGLNIWVIAVFGQWKVASISLFLTEEGRSRRKERPELRPHDPSGSANVVTLAIRG